MNAILKASDLTPAGLLELIGALRLSAAERIRAWIEAPDGWALAYWPGLAGLLPWCGAGRSPRDVPAAEVLPRAYAGRLFAPSGELRWRVLPMLGERSCRTVFLGTEDWGVHPLAARDELERRKLSPHRACHPLWGQQTRRTPGEWVELRIPHRFRYPVEAPAPAGGRVGVLTEVETWSDDRGEPHFMRLCDLRPYRED